MFTLLVASAHARTTQFVLPNGAHNLKVLLAKAGQVVTSGHALPSITDDDYPGSTQFVWAPGLRIVVSYTAPGAFRSEVVNDSYPQFVDSGTQEFDIAGVTKLVGADLNQQQFQKTVEDAQQSRYCVRNYEIYNPNESCKDVVATKTESVTRTVLTLTTD